MRTVRASAPGKLVLSGEYAVLDGAAAVAVAIDRRAVVTIASSDSEYHSVFAPGLSDTPARFTDQGRAVHWSEGGADYELFEQVWIESRVSPSGSIDITLDTCAFRDESQGSKLGIGSSAALSAALATALFALGGEEPEQVAMRAHRRFQGGTGSGVDVATSLSGGVIRFRLGGDAPCPLRWPDGLCYSVYWSGTVADTRTRLERLESRPETGARQQLVESANRFAQIFAAGDVAQILVGLEAYCESLRHFDDEHGLDVYGAGHGMLANAAPGFGVVYKPCGAVGGDVGIALAASKDALASFSTVAGSAGFRRLDTTIGQQGAVLTKEDQE